MVGNTIINNYYEQLPLSVKCPGCSCTNYFKRDQVKIVDSWIKNDEVDAILECGVCGEDIKLY
jgi:hypothetical protein